MPTITYVADYTWTHTHQTLSWDRNRPYCSPCTHWHTFTTTFCSEKERCYGVCVNGCFDAFCCYRSERQRTQAHPYAHKALDCEANCPISLIHVWYLELKILYPLFPQSTQYDLGIRRSPRTIMAMLCLASVGSSNCPRGLREEKEAGTEKANCQFEPHLSSCSSGRSMRRKMMMVMMVIMMMGAVATEKEWFLALIQFNQAHLCQLLHKHRPTYCTVYIVCEWRQPLLDGARHLASVYTPVQLLLLQDKQTFMRRCYEVIWLLTHHSSTK